MQINVWYLSEEKLPEIEREYLVAVSDFTLDGGVEYKTVYWKNRAWVDIKNNQPFEDLNAFVFMWSDTTLETYYQYVFLDDDYHGRIKSDLPAAVTAASENLLKAIKQYNAVCALAGTDGHVIDFVVNSKYT